MLVVNRVKKICVNLSNLRYLRAIMTILFVVCIVTFASAQPPSNRPPNEISVHLGGGFSSIHYQDAPRAGFFNGYAFDFGVGYTFFFLRNWGIYVGVEHGIYNTQKSVDFDLLTPDLLDHNGYRFDLHSTTGYREAFQTSFVNVPVMFLYQTQRGNPFETWSRNRTMHQGFYAMGGVRVTLPLNDDYESKITSLKYGAYYPEMDNWAATQRFAGLGNFDGNNGSDGKIGLDLSFRISLEAGLKWRINRSFVLYTGAFCDIGLSNSTSNNRKPFRNNIAVEHITDFMLLEFPDRANTVIAGIKVRLALSRIRDSSYCPF